jgi:hypothetical protein
MKSTFAPTFHRDNTITLWDVDTQQWVRTGSPTAAQMYSMARDVDPARVRRHCRLPGMDVVVVVRKVGLNFGRSASILTTRGVEVWSGPVRPSEMRDQAQKDGEAKAKAMGWVVTA